MNRRTLRIDELGKRASGKTPVRNPGPFHKRRLEGTTPDLHDVANRHSERLDGGRHEVQQRVALRPDFHPEL
jgi:hypothetical protein